MKFLKRENILTLDKFICFIKRKIVRLMSDKQNNKNKMEKNL